MAGDFKSDVKVDELSEYAILLQRAGSPKEAIGILEDKKLEGSPRALLSKSFCYFNLWDYEQALEPLKQYISITEDYQNLIGRVNLAAAYVNLLDFENARPLLLDCIEETKRNQHQRLYGNCYELLSQSYILAGQWVEASICVDEAKKYITNPHSVDGIFVEAASSFIKARKQKSMDPILECKKLALSLRRYETLRDLDLYSLLLKYDTGIHYSLYYGTPHEAYRNRITKLLGQEPEGEFQIFGFAPTEIDFSESFYKFKAGKLPHRFLNCLIEDFYKPKNINQLFVKLYPDEHFDIFSSPQRVHQVLKRTRELLIKSNLDMEIEESQGTYSLKVGSQLSFKVNKKMEPLTQTDLQIKELYNHLGHKNFTANEAKKLLKTSESTVYRLLTTGIEEGVLGIYGAGRHRTYYFNNQKIIPQAV